MMTFKVYDLNIKIALLLAPMTILSVFMDLRIELIMLLCIVFAHELAQCFAAKFFNVRIMEIEIFPRFRRQIISTYNRKRNFEYYI